MNNRERQLYLEYRREHPWATADYSLRVAQALAFAEDGSMMWTECLVCKRGVLLPLSDFGPEGASLIFKAWACSNPKCGFVIRIDKGQLAHEVVGKNGGTK
jgi:hypothetical protein